MVPGPTMLGRFCSALIADNQTLGSGTYSVDISLNPFTPATLQGFTRANFDGFAMVGASTFLNGIDPLTGNRKLTLLPPAGGFKFSTTGSGNLPQSIYGYKIVNNNNNETVGADLLTAPIPLTVANQTFYLGLLEFQVPPSSFQG